jgi:hypothetical protein
VLGSMVGITVLHFSVEKYSGQSENVFLYFMTPPPKFYITQKIANLFQNIQSDASDPKINHQVKKKNEFTLKTDNCVLHPILTR